jgi:hypothetical protein
MFALIVHVILSNILYHSSHAGEEPVFRVSLLISSYRYSYKIASSSRSVIAISSIDFLFRHRAQSLHLCEISKVVEEGVSRRCFLGVGGLDGAAIFVRCLICRGSGATFTTEGSSSRTIISRSENGSLIL